jgi:UDP-N-acetylmuramoyl-tripeptide--D-alanyl-D-alanine ligase
MKKPVEIQLSIPGEHNAVNALAAAAVGNHFRVPARDVRGALEELRPSSRRMEVLNLEGVVIFNDTYNANPDSMLASLRTLAATRVRGKKIAVLADMRELGEAGPEEHDRVGKTVRDLGIDYLLTFGALALRIHKSAGLAQAVHYEQKNMLAEYLAELIAPGDAILVKGSRGMKMEDVVAFLQERLRSSVGPFG